jgi:C1A family cysteine protease
MATTLAGEFESGLSGHGGHGLAQVEAISSKVVDNLASLGITDTEQLIAAVAVEGIRSELAKHLKITQKDLDAMADEAEKAVSPSLVNTLKTPAEADLSLGALEPTPEMMAETEAISMMVSDEEAVALPGAVSWVKKMPKIRDQAARGTCVAFALSALHEFYRKAQNNVQDFSEQHLYYETKRIDGHPNACGTWQSKAVQVLAQRGQCRENVWTYNPNPPCNNHGTMPSNARADAANFKFQTEAVNPKDVNGIKTVLASGWLVTFSIPVFNSWFQSAETRRTGRITMPIGNESSIGGHAMCFIGYQDDSTAPGGGYFILRNSWGEKWASESPYGVGNGTIPYQYIVNHNWESYTTLPEHLVNVTYDLDVEFHGSGGECWVKFPFFRISNLHPSRAVRINRLLLRSWKGEQVIDEFELRLDPGGILEPGQPSRELLLEGLRLKANGSRRRWSYRVTWNYSYTWWQRATAEAVTAPGLVEATGEKMAEGSDDKLRPYDDLSTGRTITIDTGGDVNIIIR